VVVVLWVVNGDGKSAANKFKKIPSIIKHLREINNRVGRGKLTSRLWGRYWIPLQERMIEKDIERHSFFSISSQ
jgi:hypothetical protein